MQLHAQRAVVVLTRAPDLRSSVEQLAGLRAAGMEVCAIAAPGTYVGSVDAAGTLNPLRSLGEVYYAAVDDAHMERMRTDQQIGLHYLNALLSGTLDNGSVRAPMDWIHHPEGTGDRTGAMEERGMAGDDEDWTCTEDHNSECMLGTVLASTFFIESNGSVDPNTYSWSQPMIDGVKLQVIDAWSIWSHTAALNGRTLTAVMDWYEPAGGISSQGYEPVLHPSAQDGLWINAIMHNAGRDESSTALQLNAFNHDRRGQVGTDRSFCCFIACNPVEQGAPNQFTDGKIGYAFLGGPYVQLLYKANGWGTDQMNRVYGHEIGHIFHAFDEYAASGTSNCLRSFNGVQNLNFQGSTCNGNGACVMVDNSFSGAGAARQWNMCPQTPYHLGWSGLLSVPVCLSPINDALVASAPVTLNWSRSGAPSSASCYVKIFDRSNGALVYCGDQAQSTSLALPLLNGQYDWLVTEGNSAPLSGYAGVRSAMAHFSVGAPLNASFNISAGTICAGAYALVTDAATGSPQHWTWTFTGGSPATHSGSSPPPITYTVAGTWPITLTVDNSSGSSTFTLANAVTVLGGASLPFSQQFEDGLFPPAGWTCTDGANTGEPLLTWTADATGSCNQGISALVQAHNFSGPFASPTLTTPRIDLTTAVAPYMRFRYAYAQESAAVTETLYVTGYNCDHTEQFELAELGGGELATNGGAYVPAGAWQPIGCGQWREAFVPLYPLDGDVAQFEIRLATSGGQNFYLDDIRIFEGCVLDPRSLLQGPFDATSGLMSDTLRIMGLIPLVEPYTASGYVFRGGGGGEQLQPQVLSASGATAIVDWVVLELHDALAPSTIVSSRAALIQRNGTIVDVDGVSALRFGVVPGNYFVAVKHRNHLGCMTAAPVALGPVPAILDMSDPTTPTWGNAARYITGANALLWCGDAHGNADVKYTGQSNDRDAVFLRMGGALPTGTVPGYWSEDVNMDGHVRYTGSMNDRDPILQNLDGLPTYVRLQQIP